MERIRAFWNRGWLGKAVLSLVGLLIICCVIGILFPRRTSAPTVSATPAAATEQATPLPVATAIPEPTALPAPTNTPAPTATPAPTFVVIGVAPQGTDCPADHPVKGNIVDRGDNKGDKIYHIPGSGSYAATKPERCFVDVAEAEQAGYRPPR
jgi:hypothetical protein